MWPKWPIICPEWHRTPLLRGFSIRFWRSTTPKWSAHQNYQLYPLSLLGLLLHWQQWAHGPKTSAKMLVHVLFTTSNSLLKILFSKYSGGTPLKGRGALSTLSIVQSNSQSGHFLLKIAELMKKLWHLEDSNWAVGHYRILKQNILYIICNLVTKI